VTAFLAVGAAAVYGAGDFFGGVASRRADPLHVGAISQIAGLLLGVLLLPFFNTTTAHSGQLAWAVAGGLSGGAGVVGLYAALALGQMSVIAPIAGVCAAAVPVLVGTSLGEHLSEPAIIGIGLAIVAIGLVSRHQQNESHQAERLDSQIKLKKGIALATVAGIALGFFFVCVAEARGQGSPSLLLVARLASSVMFAGIVISRRTWPKLGSMVGAAAAGAGLLDMMGGLLYILAARISHLAVVGVLASLYPVSTIILARTALREHISLVQKVGIMCAVAAILLVGIR